MPKVTSWEMAELAGGGAQGPGTPESGLSTPPDHLDAWPLGLSFAVCRAVTGHHAHGGPVAGARQEPRSSCSLTTRADRARAQANKGPRETPWEFDVFCFQKWFGVVGERERVEPC